MNSYLNRSLLLSAALAMSLSACSKDEPPIETEPQDMAVVVSSPDMARPQQLDMAQSPIFKLNLTAPTDLMGTPRQLVVALFDSLPPAGPPSGGILVQKDKPSVTPGQTLMLSDDVSTVKGDYFVLAILYMQGGGTFSPKKGVDYTAQTASKVTFTGKAIDLGNLTFKLY